MKKKLSIMILLFFILQQGCSEFLVDGPEQNTKLADFEQTWEIAKKMYPFFEFKKINWDSLHTVYRPQALSCNGDEIYMVLYDMFSQLKDGHIEIRTEGGFPVATYLTPRYSKDKDAYSPEIIRKYFSAPLELTGEERLEYGITNNIGYVRLSSFKEGGWIKSFTAIMASFRSTEGIIIDVRHNTGGNKSTADYIMSHFIDKPFEVYFWGRDNNKYTETLFPVSASGYLKPVVILVNGVSFSAAELFPERMRQLNNVTVAGDTTGGGGGSVGVFKLPSGKRLKIPTSCFKRNDGTMVEWNGILPDILVTQTKQDILSGNDRQLEYAIKYLRSLKSHTLIQ